MSSENPTTNAPGAPETGRLGWVIIYVPSVEHGLAVYEQAFGLARKFVGEGGRFGALDTRATTLAFVSEELADTNFEGGFQRGAAEAPPYNVELALVFDDV